MAIKDENITLCFPRHSSSQNPKEPVLVRTPKPVRVPAHHVLIRVDRFGFSANNVTYQALGEAPHFRYFDYHPAPEAGNVSPKTHGLVPVWGFGTIVRSTHPRISEGERVYGYLAPTRYLLVEVSPSDVNKHAFYVPRPHFPADRRPYNQFLRCEADPQYHPSLECENLAMLYRPLFWTSYWCEDWLFTTDYRNADIVLISSASSKTAFCLAYRIRKRVAKGDVRKINIVGMTSKGNVAFTKSLGLYDNVISYDSFTSEPCFALADGKKWVYADVAGSDTLNERVFAHFGSTKYLVAAIALGMTNLSPDVPDASVNKWSLGNFADHQSPVPSPAVGPLTYPAFMEHFFMVEWLNLRKHQLTPVQIFGMQNQAWDELLRDCGRWVKVETISGSEAVKQAYGRIAKGGLGPDKGFVWSLWDEGVGTDNLQAML